CFDDERRARVARPEPCDDLTCFLPLEPERGHDDVGAVDGRARVELVKWTARRRPAGGIRAAADGDVAAGVAERRRQPEPGARIGMLDQDARPLREPPRPELDGDGLRSHTATVPARFGDDLTNLAHFSPRRE